MRASGRRVILAGVRRDKDRIRKQWGLSDRRGETLVADLHILLADICKATGFCSALADDIVRGRDPLTAEAFAMEMLAQEGWPDPENSYEWRPQFVKLFIDRYGPAISAADYAEAFKHEDWRWRRS